MKNCTVGLISIKALFVLGSLGVLMRLFAPAISRSIGR